MIYRRRVKQKRDLLSRGRFSLSRI